MKNLILSIGVILCLTSCEDVITLDVKDGVEQLVVDGWLTNKYEDQVIKLTYSQAYFDNSAPKPVLGAEVIVFEADSTAHTFQDIKGNGIYILPKEEAGFLKEGGQYALFIGLEGEQFAAISKFNRVPPIDSVAYEYFDFPFSSPDSNTVTSGFLAQFYGRDPLGEGDTYWIRTTKNDTLINNPTQISLAYDAGFSPGSKSDGLLFIQPIRQSINDGLYRHNDKISVDLWSITPDAYLYLLQVRQESGNGGIFATPPANIPTNIFNLNDKSPKKALGFFGISAVSTFSTTVDSTLARPKR
jgi:predicted RecA/RadA family phage recombinase